MRAAALQAAKLVWFCGGGFQGAVQRVSALDSAELSFAAVPAWSHPSCLQGEPERPGQLFLSPILALSTEQTVSRMVHCAQFQTKAAALPLHRYRTCRFLGTPCLAAPSTVKLALSSPALLANMLECK